jgi:hypothetical protein
MTCAYAPAETGGCSKLCTVHLTSVYPEQTQPPTERVLPRKRASFGIASKHTACPKFFTTGRTGTCGLSSKRSAKRFVSIGSGNCDLEIDLGLHLRSTGRQDFVIDCLDLNPDMLERGRSAAQRNGVAAHLNFVQADFNEWNPAHEYDAVIANQSLHHVFKL